MTCMTYGRCMLQCPMINKHVPLSASMRQQVMTTRMNPLLLLVMMVQAKSQCHRATSCCGTGRCLLSHLQPTTAEIQLYICAAALVSASSGEPSRCCSRRVVRCKQVRVASTTQWSHPSRSCRQQMTLNLPVLILQAHCHQMKVQAGLPSFWGIDIYIHCRCQHDQRHP